VAGVISSVDDMDAAEVCHGIVPLIILPSSITSNKMAIGEIYDISTTSQSVQRHIMSTHSSCWACDGKRSHGTVELQAQVHRITNEFRQSPSATPHGVP
jgi:hypothetical protein